MSEFVHDRSRETGPLLRPEEDDFQSLRGEARVIEAIRQQPQELRKGLMKRWEEYKGMLQEGKGGMLSHAEQRFFDEILAEENTVPPDFEALQRGTSFPSNHGRDTAPIKGAETMAEAPMDQTVPRHYAVIIEPEELKD